MTRDEAILSYQLYAKRFSEEGSVLLHGELLVRKWAETSPQTRSPWIKLLSELEEGVLAQSEDDFLS